MRIPVSSRVATLGLLLLIRVPAAGDDWPQWRGPTRQGISRETGLLSTWPAGGPKRLWIAKGLGDGYPGVVVSKGRAFTVGRKGDKVFAFAVDVKTGKRLWVQSIGTTSRIPSSTPTVDNNRLYALDPDGDLVCLDVKTGREIWQRQFLKEFAGRMQSGRGYGESPLIDGDRVVCTPGGPKAAIVALDKYTGKTIWQATIPKLGPKGGDGAGFSSIVISHGGGIKQYIQLMGRGLVGIRADNGQFLWGHNNIANPTANIPTPVAHGDFIFSANGYNAGSVLLRLRPEGAGGVKAETVYSLRGGRFQNHHGGFIHLNGYIFGGHGSNNGLPTCVELATGRIVWKRRGPGTGSAAVLYADGHLYYKYQDGVIALIEATSQGYRLKGKFQLEKVGGDSWNHAALANGVLYLRDKQRLFAYQLDGTTESGSEPLPLTTDLKALQGIGATVDRLSHASLVSSANREHWFHYITNSERHVPRVTLDGRHLTADGGVRREVLARLRRIRDPFLLNLGGTDITSDGLRQLISLPTLGALDLEFCAKIDDDALGTLADGESLRVLMLTGTRVSPRGLRHLLKSKVVALDLEVCPNIDDNACGVLAKMKQLRALNLKKSGFEPRRISNKGLETLQVLPALEALNVYGNKIDDAGMPFIGRMVAMRHLNLGLIAITDKGLVHLRSLKRLRHLDLLFTEGFAGPRISNASLETLRALRDLESLNLTKANVNDDSINALAELQALKRLNLLNTQVTTSGEQRLKSRLPNCAIQR